MSIFQTAATGLCSCILHIERLSQGHVCVWYGRYVYIKPVPYTCKSENVLPLWSGW